MKKIAVLLILMLVSISLFSQFVVKEELFKVQRESVEFVNYEGPHAKFETADEIRGIGIYLGNQIKGGESRNSYYGRYSIIHAVEKEGQGLFNADILIIEKDAVVDHINNIRRILSGYLQASYSYSREDADIIAEFATYYNAVYRGDFQYFISMYNKIVINNLDEDKAGISTRYLEWPGATELIVPLSVSGELKIDTDTISNEDVIEDLRTKDDKGIEPRKDIVELKEREIEKEQDQIEDQKEELKEESRDLKIKKDQLEKDKESLTDSEIKEREEDITVKETDLKEKEEEIKEREEDQQTRQEAVLKEREQIAEDEKKLIDEKKESFADTTAGIKTIPFLIIDGSDSDLMGRLALINTLTGEIDRRSSINTVRGRRYYLSGKDILIVSGIDREPQAVRLMFLDSETLEVKMQGNTDVFSDTDILLTGNSIFAVVRENGKWYVGKFNKNLELQVRSEHEILAYTPLQLNDGILYVQLDNGRVVALNSDTLKINE